MPTSSTRFTLAGEKEYRQAISDIGSNMRQLDAEMRKALHMAGYDIDPALFISLAASKVKKTIYRN